MQRKRYDFPDVSVCFFEDMGCDTDATVECAESTIEKDLAREAFAGEADGFVVAGNATIMEVTAGTSEVSAVSCQGVRRYCYVCGHLSLHRDISEGCGA